MRVAGIMQVNLICSWLCEESIYVKHPYKMVRMSLEKKNRFMDRSCRILQRESFNKKITFLVPLFTEL